MIRSAIHIILFTLLLVSQGTAQDTVPITNRCVSIDVFEENLPEVLDLIGEQADFSFSYDPDVIPAGKIITLKALKITVEEAMQKLFGRYGIHYKEEKDHIILLKEKQKPSPEFIKLNGTVIDKKSGDPLPYVNIVVKNRPVGTITNSDGNYIFNLPHHLMEDTLVFSFLGYDREYYAVKALVEEFKTITLNPLSIRLKEIKVTYTDPNEIVIRAIDNIPKNYNNEEVLMDAFFREVIKVDNRYSGVSEAVMQVLKTPNNVLKNDKIRIVRGRKSPFIEPHRRVNFRLMGGPYNIMNIDVIKNRPTFLSKNLMSLYNYKLDNIVFFSDRPTYVIKFTSAVFSSLYPLFDGTVYIDSYSYAIVKASFKMTRYSMHELRASFIKKVSPKLRAKPVYVEYNVSYIPVKGKWYLNTASGSVKFKVKSRKKLINTVFHTESELLVTNRIKEDIGLFKRDEIFRAKYIFAEMPDLHNSLFWGGHNVIEPDEELQKALARFAKDLEKNTENNPLPGTIDF